MRRATTVLLGAAAAVPLLVACGTGGGDLTSAPVTRETSETGETTTPQEPTPDAPMTGASMTGASTTGASTADVPVDDPTGGGPAFPESTAAQFVEPAGEWDLVLTDVRVGAHEGFDRIVLEFTGAGTPGWAVDYVDEARLDGSGEAVTLRGDAILDIYASGTTWPADGYYDGPRTFRPEDGGDVDDVHVAGTFEGYTQVLAGIDGDASPFRVFALTDPARLVVDVADDGAD